jgi:hypothetical protein
MICLTLELSGGGAVRLERVVRLRPEGDEAEVGNLECRRKKFGTLRLVRWQFLGGRQNPKFPNKNTSHSTVLRAKRACQAHGLRKTTMQLARMDT